MKVKESWTNEDFDVMSWHDSYIYSISFPDESQKLCFDMDYLFKWELNEKIKRYKFWVSPCHLTYLNVINLKIDLSFSLNVGLFIDQIVRSNPKITSTNLILWEYRIETDSGIIVFEATDYVQTVNRQPVLSNSQTLLRNNI